MHCLAAFSPSDTAETLKADCHAETYHSGKDVDLSALLSEFNVRSRSLGLIAEFTGESIIRSSKRCTDRK